MPEFFCSWPFASVDLVSSIDLLSDQKADYLSMGTDRRVRVNCSPLYGQPGAPAAPLIADYRRSTYTFIPPPKTHHHPLMCPMALSRSEHLHPALPRSSQPALVPIASGSH